MKLALQRVQHGTDCTIGSLSIDGGARECWTLEDTVRPDGIKVFGETAIPAGDYHVDITWSPRFQRDLPLLLNVKGFVGVRIHPGNDAADTEGCILVGLERQPASILRSRDAFNALFPKLAAAKARGEDILLTVTN